MDKLLYIASSGANQDLVATSLRANNLANAQTNGFKAQLEQARSMPVYGEGLPTRVFAMTESPTNNYESGPMIQTGRDLDVAVQGDGWFAVQDAQGNEAYSRDGNFQLGADGVLEDVHGNMVMGDTGPIFLPVPLDNLNIAADGTISIRPQGAPESVLEEVGRLKLVKPEYRDMERGNDGLFRMQDGSIAQADETVAIRTGMLEGSNVNAIDEMVNMLSLQRHYELQVKMMKKADTLDTRGNMLLRII
ncbi:flagellar basal-body rod protein FlgF [Marisediminitalea aggregata]|jgi:flagellar basal-body rod protein FlgF|uniref:Flagellar basal-body rod protein FlgF n=1 Tax=Marisediminitalea aggregata TaxID=634436 RepID=A0A1M5GRI9_9ALTE|nr:flagellar basal-body rod protein FlgF [Marisediminitalea aggregata]MCP3863038.1 flagellar basal-body rod protein FlgF [Aestuariibacter sp.]MEC7470094.1 flagellar basal-body rod protein FlgF [Pseudomonadota bacterium]BBO28655.1 flagellar basal-body rod protein FlgF [Alteromonas sp. I4]MCP4232909.1 flagellar basal-body rod protein FlgF [Aestuariibacter sp.]MCP4527094.1 flagellar basal-body rod protein FlgF [Aestuariibacter sp.]